MPPFTIQRTARSGQLYIEKRLDVGEALPLQMVLIPAGTFMMGSPDDELERQKREGPQHQVTVPQFLMGRYPVTQAQYEGVMEANPARGYDEKRFVAPNKPVVGVTWHNAVGFCDRLSKLTDKKYRLPSEAEWEYACRAGTTTPFYFGKTLTTEIANFNGNGTYGDGAKGDYRNQTTPVDYFGIANAFGLSDMHGNVYEWCQDYGSNNYEGAPDDGTAWIEGADSSRRIARGGSWDDNPRDCRSAYRAWAAPDIDDGNLGFRVCCSPPRILQ